jgi:murein DD-endopeptidase MepM/ murein hydrolase activator NlpD
VLAACGGAALLGLAPQSQGTSSERIIIPLALPASAPAKGAPRHSPQDATRLKGTEKPASVDVATSTGRSTGGAGMEAAPLTIETARIGKGDSLSTLFKKRGLGAADLLLLVKAKPHGKRLKRVLPGQKLDFHLDETRSLMGLEYHLDNTHFIRFSRADKGFTSKLVEVPLERRVTHAAGQIRSSLFLAGQRAGLSDRLIMEMVEIFGWDIDFALDIRVGDNFLVVYEELFKDGEKLGEGEILAAEFVNRGKQFRAVRYIDPKKRVAYFSPDGLSMRKAFLRTPVKFGRVSSRFNLKRRHPVLHKIRAHRGVDYAARRGTAIRASGDGKVIFVGRKGGYGRTVILRHGSTYTTLYAHMSRYPKGMRPGRRVQQGQVIGYVGSSGLATGSHLHYEFRVRNLHRNPLTVKLPKAAPVPERHKSDFLTKTGKLVTQLDVLSRMRLAASN